MKKFFLISIATVATVCLIAQTNTPNNKADKRFHRMKFESAANAYSGMLSSKSADSIYLFEQLGHSYRAMHDPAVAEFWYKKAVDNGSRKPEVVWQLVQMLRMNMKYEDARKFLIIYQSLNPSDYSIEDVMIGLENVRELQKNRGIYKVEPAAFNTAKNDISAAFLADSLPVFVSNRRGKVSKSLSDDWKGRSFNRLYFIDEKQKAKAIKRCKPYGSSSNNQAAYNPSTNELIFAAAKQVKEGAGREVSVKLFSMTYPKKGKRVITELPFNSDSFSVAHPALSADGNTLYFVSDMPGGFGGSDIYMSKKENGIWLKPMNLGKAVNTPHDETYPFVAADGSLYFSSNGFDGLGGLDVYRTTLTNGKWIRPENLHAPINSNYDDFAFTIKSDNKTGFFTSNRTGGKGEDDIYTFSYDPAKADYKILAKVFNEVTKKPIEVAEVVLLCGTDAPESFATDALGEARVVVKGNRKCVLSVKVNGYKSFSKEISRANAGVLEVALTPDVIDFIVMVKEKESGKPMNDAVITLRNSRNEEVTYATDVTGRFQSKLPSGKYSLFSRDYLSLKDEINTDEAGSSMRLERVYELSKADYTVNLPLTANCFSSAVRVRNLKTGESYSIAPNSSGEVRLDLLLNTTYVVEHNQRFDTINTTGLFPGDVIEGPCKFTVGQTWVLNNVYYDLDKANIRKDAALQLNQLVRIMNEHPSLEIQLGSHTDCRGTRAYNNQLSLRRAKSAIDYMVGKGIKLKRFLAAGFGETRLVNNCACEPTNQSDCTDEQHQANRRTEVKVLKY